MNNTVNRASLGAKKNNLIKRLWTDSHEKQSPQRFARYAAMLIMLLTLGVGQMWGYTIIRNGCLVGQADGTWSNSETMTQVGSSNVYYKTYNSPTATTDLKFRIGTGTDWNTEKNADGIDNLNSNIVMVGNGDGDNNIKFQVPTSVPVTIYYNSSTKKIWIKVESYKTDVLDGQSMFYYGTPSSWGASFSHFYDNGTRKFGNYAANSYADNSANLAIGVYNANGSTSYSASHSDSWSGVNHTGLAGGAQIQTYNNGSDQCYYNAASTFSFGTTAYTIVVGQTIASFPTISFTSKTSGVGSALSLENYYYSTATSGQTWTAFTPGTTESSLAAGTYYIKALATDGAIYMASSNYITLTVNSAPVLGVANATSVSNSSATFNATATLNSNTTSSYGFKYGAGSSYDTKAELVSGGTSASTSGSLASTTFSKEVTGLSASTTYYYISYVVVNGTTYYSNDVKSFTTSAAPTYSLTVSAGTGISAVTGSTDNISANQSIAITATVATGYTWSTWTKTGAGTLSTFTAGTKDQTVKVGTLGNITLTASATENMSSLSTSCSYDAGNPSYAAPSVSGSATTVGYSTTRSITAASASTGYTFVGWTITNGTRTDGGDEDATTITVRSNGDGAAVSVVANYHEVLTQSTWVIKGGSALGGTAWSTEHALTKKSGYSTSDVVYHTFSIASTNNTADLGNNDFNFKVVKKGASDTYYGLGTGDGQWWYYRDTDPAEQTLGTSNKDIQIRADVAGNYEVKVDYSDASNPTVTITFPTSYTLTYAIGDVAGNDGSITSSPSTASGSKVLSGSTVTLTAPDAKDGYTWKGWYLNSNGSGVQQEDDQEYAVTMNADKTLYACYTEESYTVTVNASSGGKVSYNGGSASSSCSASAGVVTASQTISAIPDDGYAFVGWTDVDAEHHITNFTATWNNTNKGWDLTVNADDNTTITANFEPRFALVGAIDATGNPAGGMPSPTWDADYAAAFTYSAGTYTLTRELTSPNTTYKFQIVDRRAEVWTWRGYTSSENNLAVDNTTTYTLNGGKDVFFNSRGIGNYIFTIAEENIAGVIYPKVKIQDGANSHWITTGTTTFFNGGASSATATSSTAGGNVTAEDGEDTPNPIVNGNYIKDGGTITFTADPEDGYTFEGWYSNSACSSAITHNGTTIVVDEEDKTLTLSSIDEAKTVYAKFSEIMTTVDLAMTGSGNIQYWDGDSWEDAPSSESVGVHTTCSLKVVPNAGYYFSGWTRSETPDFHLNGYAEANTNVTLTGDGAGTAGTLTANFVELDKIYFRNIFDDGENEPTRWANVYVYFDVDWDTYNNPSWGVWYATGKVRTQMTQIEETDVYWAYVPRAFTSGNLTHVAFSEQEFTANLNFRTGNAAFRSDYNKLLNMFVPHHTKSSTQTYTSGSSYTTNYYSNGYWMKYDTRAGQGAGYYLKKYNGRNSYSLDSVFRATNDDATFIQCRIRVDGTEDSNNKYMIVSAAGLNYITDSTITSLRNTKGVSEDTRTLTENDVYFQVKATSEGFYTFILDQSGDKMKLTVDYPVSPGDYRLKHTYVGRNKANSADSTYITYSDIIKASDAASGATVSMYLSTAGTKTLVLQECTSINGTTKLPEWNAGESDGLSGVFTKVGTDGDGVYQFDITVNTSTNKVTATENIALYDGPFYIKTDCAPGGWANYTRNEMDKNTINPTAFDYYFMKWIDLDTDNSETKNIKCVIANQYNNAISDTLKSDGIATMVDGEPVLDNDGSVRFSYNSKTNALERAYLTGASNLTLETYAEGYITNYGGSTDQYGRHPGFVDDVVWTYELTVDAKLGAKAGVQATWINKAGTSKNQTLIANTNPIISGTGSGKYTMRLVFDFKTNSLISTWTPSGAISDKLSDVDVMLVREGQDPSDVITFSGTGSLAPRKLVGSLKFEKTTYFGNVASWTSTTRPLLTFFVSFPFDVKVSDVFGLNSAYGDAYVIRKYDGAERASKGFFRGDGTTSFWKDLTTEDTMNAYEGYIVVLDNDYFNSDAYSLWGSKSELYLYFPSSKGGTIASGSKTITVPVHTCGIDRTFDNGGGKTLNHMNTDSHWNLIGVPVFTTYDDGNSPAEGTPGAIFADTEGDADAFNYFYVWSSTGNDFAISSAKDYAFKAMHGYMVQYHGDVTFTGSVFTPASVAARRTVEKKNYDIELQVLNNEAEMLNRTYVALRDGASSEFVLNEDVYLSPNNRDAEIYTFAGEYDVAANRLPVENQLVQMGLNVHKAGNYTISMPSTFSGTATLVDTYTNTRTNLAIDEYEVNLPKGTCDDRFLLELNIHKVPTAIDGVDGGSLKDGNAHKFIMNDRMYILKNGVIYDACGNRVQ